jgi:ABC-type glycerol-3-phosphate transport system substrate-binding protein
MRISCAVLIVCILLASGCGSGKKDDGRTTVVFWHSFVASTVPSLDTLLREFEQTHPAIHVKAQYIPTGDGLIQKLVAANQSGTAPDISWIHADFLDKLVEAGAILPLDRFIRGDDPLVAEDLNDIFAPLLDAGTYNGVLYAMPMEATSLALLYNRGLFRKSGLDPDHPPQTWEELKEFAAKLTMDHDQDGRIDQYGFFVPVFPASGDLNIWMILQWTPFLWQAGGREMKPDQSGVLFNSEAGVQALSLWKWLYDTEEFSKFGIAHDLGFASERLAMVLDGPWNLPRYRQMKNVDWAVAPLPAGPAGRATYLAGEQLAIFRQSTHTKEAWAFVKWIVQKDVQARFSMHSGYLPVRRSVLEMDVYRRFLSTDPALKAFVDQMCDGRGRQTVPGHRVEINRFLAEAIERATLGKRDPRECLDQAAAQANTLLRR